jgi:glycosyltransferase involved in cell wall biosynthesis
MRITQLTCNLRAGGAERLAVDLSCALAARGHAVRFVVIDRFSGDEGETAKLRDLAASGIEVVNLGRSVGTNIVGLLSSCRSFAAELKAHPCDILHSHLPYAHCVAAAGRRLVGSAARQLLTVHTSREHWATWQEKLIGTQPIAYCSHVALRRSNHQYSRVWIAPNGVRFAAFAIQKPDGDPLESLGLPTGRRRIISVGSLLDGKNYRTSIEAIAQLRHKHDVQLIVCGAGDQGYLRAIVRRLGIGDRVSLLGPRSDVPSLLATSDLFLSASRYEGMPIAVLEALASGLPAVLSPIEEHEEVAGNMPGCVIADHNTPAPIADACEAMLRSPCDRQGLLTERIRLLCTFDIMQCARNYESIYAELRE